MDQHYQHQAHELAVSFANMGYTTADSYPVAIYVFLGWEKIGG